MIIRNTTATLGTVLVVIGLAVILNGFSYAQGPGDILRLERAVEKVEEELRRQDSRLDSFTAEVRANALQHEIQSHGTREADLLRLSVAVERLSALERETALNRSLLVGTFLAILGNAIGIGFVYRRIGNGKARG